MIRLFAANLLRLFDSRLTLSLNKEILEVADAFSRLEAGICEGILPLKQDRLTADFSTLVAKMCRTKTKSLVLCLRQKMETCSFSLGLDV